MSSVTPAAGPIHLGMDTSKNTIVVGVLLPGEEVPVIDRIWNEEGLVRHLVSRLGDPAALRPGSSLRVGIGQLPGDVRRAGRDRRFLSRVSAGR